MSLNHKSRIIEQKKIGPFSFPIEGSTVIDLGCGKNKVAGAIGVDSYPFPGVDHVFNLETTPWDLLVSNSFETIIARHVLEHIHPIIPFMKEIHRIGKPNAKVYFETPHFSSHNSWGDPTHCRHLGIRWFEVFSQNGYLAQQTGEFKLVFSTVTFGRSWRNKIGAAIARWRGFEKWEKNLAFSYPASDVVTVLQIQK